jgi:hypothetical protein
LRIVFRITPREWWTWAGIFGSVFVWACLAVRMPQEWFFRLEMINADDDQD